MISLKKQLKIITVIASVLILGLFFKPPNHFYFTTTVFLVLIIIQLYTIQEEMKVEIKVK